MLKRIGILFVATAVCAACSSVQQQEAVNVAPAPASEREGPLLPKENETAPNVIGLDLSDVPEEYRHTVMVWMEYYQGRGRKHMERYLSRSTRYIPMMKEILRKHGMPEDLVFLALIESGFSLRARSRASAVGPWQFIKGTGRRYGLQINHWIDERQDPVKSTEAAASYLKGLYNLFGSWYLAIASYNVGENRIQKAVMKYYTRSFWELAHRRVLPRETIEYIPKFIAAGVIARNPEKYGFNNIEFEKPLEYEEVTAEQSVDLRVLAQQLEMDYDELADLNPMYRTRVAPVQGGTLVLKVPVGMKEKSTQVIAQAYTNVKYREVAYQEGKIHRVRRGDTLSTIARKYGTTVQALRDMNDLSRGSIIRVGLRLTVPARSSAKRARASVASSSRRSGEITDSSRSVNGVSGSARTHTVKPGESLYQIARLYKVSIGRLVSENKIAKRSRIMAGAVLVIPD